MINETNKKLIRDYYEKLKLDKNFYEELKLREKERKK